MALNNVLDTTHKGYLIRVFYIPHYGFDGHARRSGDDTTTFFTLGESTAQKVIDTLKDRIDQKLREDAALQQAFDNGRDAERRTAGVGEMPF